MSKAHPSLSEIQKLAFSTITQGQTNENFLSLLEDSNNFTKKQRLNIYLNSYLMRLVEIIGSDYPVLEALLEKKEFTQLVKDYLRAYPPSSHIIRDESEHLKDFVKTTELKKDLPFIDDLLEFEWLLVQSYFSPTINRKQLTSLDRLAELDPDNSYLILCPSSRLYSSEWPLDRIYEDKVAIYEKQQPVTLATYRLDKNAYYEVLDDIEITIFKLLLKNLSLTDLILSLEGNEQIASKPQRLTDCLNHWSEIGIILGVETK